jgi:hypothetical protein
VRLLPVLAAAVLAALPACGRDLPPDATYRALVRAMADRDAEAAWALLSADSQRWLQERARGAAAAAPGVVSSSARQLLVGDASLGAPSPRSIEVVSASADRAVLRVEGRAGAPQDVTLVREGGRWRVEIPRPAAAGAG